MNEQEMPPSKQEMLLRQVLEKIGTETANHDDTIIVFDEHEATALREMASSYLQGKAAFILAYKVGKLIMWVAAVYGSYAVVQTIGAPK